MKDKNNYGLEKVPCEAIISELRQENGKLKSYIYELEHKNDKLRFIRTDRTLVIEFDKVQSNLYKKEADIKKYRLQINKYKKTIEEKKEQIVDLSREVLRLKSELLEFYKTKQNESKNTRR